MTTKTDVVKKTTTRTKGLPKHKSEKEHFRTQWRTVGLTKNNSEKEHLEHSGELKVSLKTKVKKNT